MDELKNVEATIEVASPLLPTGFTIGSRKVEIKFVDNFSVLPKDNAYRKEFVKKIGSAWKGTGKKDIIRGLDSAAVYSNGKESMIVDEERRYLPTILGISPTSPTADWEKVVKYYWADFTISVPYDGLELEVGFEVNSEGIANPINVEDYIKYKFCRVHPHVAVTDIELEGFANFELQIIDKAKEEQRKFDQFDVVNRAELAYAKLISSDDSSLLRKIEFILELEGGDRGQGVNTMHMETKRKHFELKKLRDRDAAKFVRLLNDKNLEVKALLRKAVSVGRITKEGESYYYGDIAIGSNLMEAVAYLDNPTNSDKRLKLTDVVNQLMK